jgi:hypothetical protein
VRFIASVTLARVDHEPEDRAVDTDDDDDDDGRRIVQKKRTPPVYTFLGLGMHSPFAD